MQPFVAIDFETANGKRASACSVGLARFGADGVLVDTFHSLILPHRDYRFFNPFNTKIHGIRDADVAHAPEWDVVSPQVQMFMGDLPVVAHNFAFDGSVMDNLADLYRLPRVANQRICTLKLSRTVYSHLPKATLDTVFGHLFPGQKLNHHDAEADAIAAGMIFAEMQRARTL